MKPAIGCVAALHSALAQSHRARAIAQGEKGGRSVPQDNDIPPHAAGASEDMRRANHGLARLAEALNAADAAEIAEIAQESLDFLAMVDGLKPVYLLGRGFEEPQWVAGVLGIARELGLTAIEGRLWDAAPLGTEFPDWYRRHTSAELARHSAHYITNSAAVADELRLIAAGAGPTVAQEARLLGYPECCVAAHYRRTQAFHRATLAVLARAAGGELAEMARLLGDSVPLAPATAADQAAYDAATAVTPCPFTSLNMCDPCAATAHGPAAELALAYARLARDIDPALAKRLAGFDTVQA